MRGTVSDVRLLSQAGCDRARVARQNALKRLQEHALLFVVNRAAAHQDGPRVRGLETFAKMRDQGGR